MTRLFKDKLKEDRDMHRPIPAKIQEREEQAQGSGPVRTYFLESAFEWFGANRLTGAFVSIREDCIYVSRDAVRLAGLKPGDRVQFGLSKTHLAVRRWPSGVPLRGKDGACKVGYKRLVQELVGRGYSMPLLVQVDWVEENQMLAGRLPESKVGLTCRS